MAPQKTAYPMLGASIYSANATLSTIDTIALTQLDLPINQPINSLNQNQQVKTEMNDNKSPQENSIAKEAKATASKAPRQPMSKLSLVAIGLTIALGVGIALHAHQQAAQQKQVISQLQTDLNQLQQQVQQQAEQNSADSIRREAELQQQKLLDWQKQVALSLDKQFADFNRDKQQLTNLVNDTLKVSEQRISELQNRFAAMSANSAENNVWLIAQANYLVTLAERKIWNDRDYITARLLLKSADASLAEANDPSLLPARQAINQDLVSLSKVTFTDYDGVVLTLMGLADTVTELPLVDHYQDIDLAELNQDDSLPNPSEANTPEDKTTLDSVSSSLNDWSTNLSVSLKTFASQFIEIEKYDSYGECISQAGQNSELLKQCHSQKALVTPEQSLYLRENIRLQLYIAAQAVPRRQDIIYQRALDNVAIWVNAYFDPYANNTKVFLSELGELQKTLISNPVISEQLISHAELNKLMQTRVRSMLTH